MMRKPILAALLSAAILFSPGADAQGFLKKLKEKANEALERKIDPTPASNPSTTGEPSASEQSSKQSSGRNVNKGGGGLTPATAPDVAAQIADAEKAYNSKNFSDARYAVQQALQAVELQLGKKILQSLPLTISSLPADTLEDKVISTSWGWSNLNIQRRYTKGDKDFNVVIGNNPMYSGFANAYLSGMYAQQVQDKENIKQTKIKGHKALVKYDDNEGYTLIVPLGQSGMIVFTAVNFASEAELMSAANAVDIDSIMKLLGEQ